MLKVKDLGVDFNQGNRRVSALSEVSFDLASNAALGIVGESGSGKTTLGLSIMGLVPAKVRGEIDFDGRGLTRLNAVEWRRIRGKRIAMVFQNSLEVFNPVITVGEQVAEVLTTHLKMPPKDVENRVSTLFAMTGLDPEWRRAHAHELSGGMRQRALIAMAIACNPELLIVDEPTSALDPENSAAVTQLLTDLKQRFAFSMILISHNLTVIKKLTDRVLTLYAGRILEEGPTLNVLRTPRHPYTRGLIQAACDLNPYKDLWGIAGEPPARAEVPGCPFEPRCFQREEICKNRRPGLAHGEKDHRVACHKGGIETLLTAEGLTKFYAAGQGRFAAVDGIDLQIRKGEVVALVGPSGCGKSTLAHMLAGVIAPDQGGVYFCGQKVQGHNATRIMGGMQIVFQDPAEAVSHRFTVSAAVREPLDIMGWETTEKRDRKVMRALEGVHLPTSEDFLQSTCHGLSGGQRQRLAVARAMVTDPVFLIADEITSFLDPSTQAVLVRELKGLQNLRGFSMLFITHDIHLARKVADTVHIMARGRIEERGTAFEMVDALDSAFQVNKPDSALAVC